MYEYLHNKIESETEKLKLKVESKMLSMKE